MRKTKRFLSLFLSIAMVLSVISVGFSVSAVELDPIVLTKMERPTVSFSTSGMTRVAAGNGSFAFGNVIVKATPSGVPENNSTHRDYAYNGETPTATKIYFSSEYDVENVSVSCTSGSTNLVLSEPTVEDGVTTWEIVSGNANAGEYLEFTATYDYDGRTYSSRCYSYVENIDNSCAAVFTVHAYKILGTIYYAVVCAESRILGKGVKHNLANYDGEYGYFDAGNGNYVSNKTTGHTATYLSYMKSGSYSLTGGDSSYFEFPMDGIRHYTTIFIDTSTTSSLAELNIRMATYNIGIDYTNAKDNPNFIGTFIYSGEIAPSFSLSGSDSAANTLGYDANDLNQSLKIPRGYQMNTAYFRGSVANLSDNQMFTILNYFRTEYSGASMGIDVVNKTLSPLYLKIALVDKSALRASIQTVLSSEPTSPLVSNIYKGANPQSWYYKSGFGNFKSALANAYAVLTNETATQDEIDSAQQSLDAMYSNLVLNSADYSQVNDLLEQADEILANSEMYTAESVALLQDAYDGVIYNYNLFYQSAVDTMAGNIQKALDNMSYVDADYSAVETSVANADTSAITAYINSKASSVFNYAGQTIGYHTPEFRATVDQNAQAVADAVDSIVYGLDISRQAEVDAFAANVDSAFANFSALVADYTAVNTLKAYATSLKSSNYTNFAVLRTAVNKVRNNYSVLRQEEVDVMAQDIVTAINSLILKAATKTPLETALALTPEYPQSSYSPESYAAWQAIVAEGQAMYNDDTLTILDNQAIADKAAAITIAFEALEVIGVDKTALATALALSPEYDEDLYTEQSYSAWSALVTEGQTMYDDDTLTPDDAQAIADKAAAITAAFEALTLKPADKTALATALALTPEQEEGKYTHDTHAAWAALRSEGQQMYADETLTILDNEAIAEKAAAITEAFEALTLRDSDKAPLQNALALTPEYDEANYTAESYSAWTALRAEAQAMYDDATLTIVDNDTISAKATALTQAFEALTLKPADKTALETALALTPEYAEGNYTMESHAAWAALKAEGQQMFVNANLTIVDNEAINAKAEAITNAFNALTLRAADKTPLQTALALTPELEAEAYTQASYSAWATLKAEGQAMLEDETLTILDNDTISAKAEAITAAFEALAVDAGYSFEIAEGSEAVIDRENGFIYGLEEGVTSLDGFVAYEGCEVVYIETSAGFGTGTKVDVVYGDEIVETFYIVIFGDVTGDGYIDAFDVSILSSAANFETEFEDGSAYAFAADLNNDGFVDTFDCSILTAAANFETVLPQK